MKQLTLFDTQEKQVDEMEKIKDEWNRTRKALFMQTADLKRMYQELAHEHMILKLNICRGRI
jgi:hypothetical protein